MSAAATPAGAAPGLAADWHSIDWKKVQRTVRRLQARIVKAVREGRWGKVKALVYLLTHSFSGRALAILRVVTNSGATNSWGGRRTLEHPGGQDGRFQHAASARLSAATAAPCVHPQEQRQDASSGIPTMTDRAMQALYLLGLDPIEETLADRHSYGFRLERCCADALEQCHQVLRGPHGPSWILEGDIKSCFDRISHDWLLDHVPMDRDILRKWLKAGFLEKTSCSPPRKGHLKGGSSPPRWRTGPWMDWKPLLDDASRRHATRRTECKVHLVRYADDFIITGTSQGSPAT